VNPRVVQDDPIDWEAVQEASAREGRSSVYLAGVLDDDSSASAADLWMWGAAPDSAMPSRVRVPLRAGDGLAVVSAVRSSFADAQLGRPWLGALLIDVVSEPGPFVVEVTDGGPAQEAGLEPGDVIVSVNGLAADRVASVHQLLTDAAGMALTLGIDREGARLELALTASASPQVELQRNGDMAFPATAASLAAARMRQLNDHPDWVWELSDAATRLRAGDFEGALEVLSRAERLVPEGPGVGRGTLDYWLGMAYTLAGSRAQARESFARAAEDAAARLGHNDGPWVAPRARARLAWLSRDLPE
jgi:hypothetical protein